jgi:hypothetical protein
MDDANIYIFLSLPDESPVVVELIVVVESSSSHLLSPLMHAEHESSIIGQSW